MLITIALRNEGGVRVIIYVVNDVCSLSVGAGYHIAIALQLGKIEDFQN